MPHHGLDRDTSDAAVGAAGGFGESRRMVHLVSPPSGPLTPHSPRPYLHGTDGDEVTELMEMEMRLRC